jgi:cAMP-specific phosphodiesterase 4/high affinity cGMP-specific 3',5'-cyclic phosphodiesterase 9
MVFLGMLIKASDISNPARPTECADKWNGLVYEEFYAEGDANAAARRDVNPRHDRENNSIAMSSVGFIGALLAQLTLAAL